MLQHCKKYTKNYFHKNNASGELFIRQKAIAYCIT